MPLRDDHDAALARADALEAELERARADDEQRDAELERVEAELDDARSRLARAEEKIAKLKPKRAKPAAAPPQRAAAPPQPDAATSRDTEPAMRASTVLAIVVGLAAIIIVGFALRGGRRPSSTSAPQPVPLPAPPFVAERLLQEGLAKISTNERLSSVKIDYVGLDGNLDPRDGRIRFETVIPPAPEPPDDPSRPTGAPERNRDYSHLIASCTPPEWNPIRAWTVDRHPCSFARPSGAPPICTLGEILARARRDAAPNGLAKIKLDWGYGGTRGRWSWVFEIRDSKRGVDFERRYADDCR